MKRNFTFVLISLFVLLSPRDSFASNLNINEKHQNKKYKQNEIIVRFKMNISEDEKREIRKKIGAKVIKTSKSIRIEHWKLSNSIDTEEALEYLKSLPSIDHAEPNFLLNPNLFPNDPKFSELWHLQNIGQFANGTIGASGSDISSVQAWDIETGKNSVVIAVVDSGISLDHPDLKNNMWKNLKETPDNNLDDDHNGYIDDLVGWDFVNNDNNPSDYSRDLYGDGHGTHVAGIIAAQGNNNLGITGVMWAAQLMPLQIFDLFQKNSFEDALIQSINIILAIEYAVDNGAKIINCSFGGISYSQFQYDVINYAHQNGALLIVAAGNNSNNNDTIPYYPASYNLPNIISVAATNEKDELASYSNYGQISVDVAAPGGNGITGNIYSTTPPERVVLFEDNFESGGDKWTTSGIYESWSLTYNPLFGSTVVQDSQGYYYNNENSNITTIAPINASDYRGLHLHFRYSQALEDQFDYIYFEGSNDGSTFTTIDYGTGFTNGVYDINYWTNDYDYGLFYLRFRLKSDDSYSYDGVYIDDIVLTGTPLSFNGNEYDYKSGTSMAAPVVSGIAGLVYSHYPKITHVQVKEAILSSVDKLDSLNFNVLSGGRVNAYKAITSIKTSQLKAMPWIPVLLLDH